jgi:hypothetical protein
MIKTKPKKPKATKPKAVITGNTNASIDYFIDQHNDR